MNVHGRFRAANRARCTAHGGIEPVMGGTSMPRRLTEARTSSAPPRAANGQRSSWDQGGDLTELQQRDVHEPDDPLALNGVDSNQRTSNLACGIGHTLQSYAKK